MSPRLSAHLGWIRDFARRGLALLRAALAAIIGQVAEQHIHGVEPRGVNHRAALAPDGDESGLAQAIEMEGQGVRRESKSVGDLSRRHPGGSRLDKKTVSIKTIVLSEGGQGRNGILLF